MLCFPVGTCSIYIVGQSVYCKQLLRVLRARECQYASVLLTDATKAHQLCDINETPADCNLSPFIQINESLLYFTGGCEHILRLFQNEKLYISTTYPLLFTKTSDMTISPGTIPIRTPKKFYRRIKLIDNNTLQLSASLTKDSS